MSKMETKSDASEEEEDAKAVTIPALHNANSSSAALPPFYDALHEDYIATLAETLDSPTSLEGAFTEHLRMSGVYWSLTALSLLRPLDRVNELMGLVDALPASSSATIDEKAVISDSDIKLPSEPRRQSIVDWVFSCYDERSGGFAGNVGQDGHLLYTLSAVQILALAHSLDDERLVARKPRIVDFCCRLQQPDGSFAGDEWGEIDTRFTYCALSTLSILHSLPDQTENDGSQPSVNIRLAAEYIQKCCNTMDGGFGSVIGAESHAGQVFCCVGALAIAQSLDLVDADLLGWWLAERQVDSGGLNGRPEKQADVCYSWWILSVLSILGKVSWINGDKLATFILKCQDGEDGGIADRPDDMVDVFHTFFGIAGLSLLGHLHTVSERSYRQIDPIYALPTDIVQDLKLQGQVMGKKGEAIDERLSQYDVYYPA